VKRYPHTATISWFATLGTYNAYGVFVETTTSTVASIRCNVQPNRTKASAFTRTENGSELIYAYDVICRDRINYNVPWKTQLVGFSFKGETLKIVGLHNFQKHAEIEVD